MDLSVVGRIAGLHRERTPTAAEPGRHGLRLTFDSAAARYGRVRPGYPRELFDDLVALTGLGRDSRVLEIGCGTGQATVPLAERGYAVTAVEIGAELAAVARPRLAACPNVEVIVAAFEDWPLPAEPFDAVLSATAFHWLDPDVRVPKAADALRPGGALVLIDTHHVAGGDEGFFAMVQACYERWDPSTPPGLRLEPADSIPSGSDEIDASHRFGAVAERRYEWEAPYTSEAYLEVLQTYSGHLALESTARTGLLECIRGLIDREFDGHITKRYLNTLRVARRN